MIRVVLADDQRVVREGMATLLGLLDELEVVAAVGDGDAAIAAVAETDPDVVLMDLRMPRCDGIEATRRLTAAGARAAVVVLTTFADEPSVLAALQAGARGYLTKDAGAEEILAALLRVVDGEAALDPAVQHHVVSALQSPRLAPADRALPDGLTPREGEVLARIAAGRSNAEIAAELFVSEATVKSHVNHLFAKAGLRDRAQAVGYAFRHGIAEPGP